MERNVGGIGGDEVIRINGAQRTLTAGNLARLLEQLGYGSDRRGIAVALNGQVVPRSKWGERKLQAGDEIEIVGAVQGG